jgi:AAA domain
MHPSNVLERRAKALAADLRVLAAPDFLKLDLPPREPVLGPVLVRGSVTLLRGAPGLGKSWLALSLAYAAAAGGSACGWAAPWPARVLHVDAQMPLTLLQERLAAIAGFGGAGAHAAHPSRRPRTRPPQDEVEEEDEVVPIVRHGNPRTRKSFHPEERAQARVTKDEERPQSARGAKDEEPRRGAAKRHTGGATPNLRLLAAEAQALPMPDLGAETGRAAFMRLLFEPPPEGGGAASPAIDLLVLDGLSALLRSARGRNDPAREFAEFLSGLRRAGLCVLLVDRARTRKRIAPPFEDMLDAVIDVRRPAGLGEGAGVHMAVAVTGRGLDAAEAFELQLVAEVGEGEAPGWRRVARLDAAVLEAWRLQQQGASYRAIARTLGVSLTTAWRLARRGAALDPALRAAALAQIDGELAGAGETAETGETGETPETEEPALSPIAAKCRQLERDLWLRQDGPATPREAVRQIARLVAAAKIPPGVLFQDPDWKAIDRAMIEQLGAVLGTTAFATRPLTLRAPPAAPSPGRPGSSACPAPSPPTGRPPPAAPVP